MKKQTKFSKVVAEKLGERQLGVWCKKICKEHDIESEFSSCYNYARRFSSKGVKKKGFWAQFFAENLEVNINEIKED